MRAGKIGGRGIGNSELKKQRKSYSYPAIIQSLTEHLGGKEMRENERQEEQERERREERWLEE